MGQAHCSDMGSRLTLRRAGSCTRIGASWENASTTPESSAEFPHCGYIPLRLEWYSLIQFSLFAVCGWIENGKHMHSVIELRSTRRYRLSVPALFMWEIQDWKSRNGKGVTRDTNALGVYVQTDSLPPVGARVQMEILLPQAGGFQPRNALARRRHSSSMRERRSD